jgi:hypothetical protein
MIHSLTNLRGVIPYKEMVRSFDCVNRLYFYGIDRTTDELPDMDPTQEVEIFVESESVVVRFLIG